MSNSRAARGASELHCFGSSQLFKAIDEAVAFEPQQAGDPEHPIQLINLMLQAQPNDHETAQLADMRRRGEANGCDGRRRIRQVTCERLENVVSRCDSWPLTRGSDPGRE